ncbi:MAG: tRNA guanosine(15) transglycosylase TgtA [Candidatus Methanofastidiosia archaeon]
MFEIKAKDGLGRIGRLQIRNKVVETPTIMPVINPGKLVISPSEMKDKFGTKIIITNSYIIYSSPRLKEKALGHGVHKLLEYDGVVVTDSGSFQLAQYHDVNVTNSEIVQFQNDIDVDVATFLDIPTPPDATYEKAKNDLNITLERAREARILREGYLNGTIQGSTHLSLRKKSARDIGEIDFEIHPIGAVVPLFLQYRFKDVVDIVLTAKKELSPAKPVHLFGAGHPMAFSLFVLLGCDLFDSAAYVLYARDNRYLTITGTKKLDELAYLPCKCPVCSSHTLKDLMAMPSNERIRLLAMHNLHVTYEEFACIKQAIHEGSLWDLVEMRVRSHPKLYYAFKEIKKYRDFIRKYDPLVKRSTAFYTGLESKSRPVFHTAKLRAQDRVSPMKTLVHPIIGQFPESLAHTYPFNVEMDKEFEINVPERTMVEEIADYQFGRDIGKRLFKDTTISYSRNDRVRTLISDDVVVATLRARDGLLILGDEGQRRLHNILPSPSYRVMVDDEVSPYIKSHGDVFSKFVKGIDTNLYSGEEVLIVDENDSLLGSGWLLLSPPEIPFFTRGIAVKTRRGTK